MIPTPVLPVDPINVGSGMSPTWAYPAGIVAGETLVACGVLSGTGHTWNDAALLAAGFVQIQNVQYGATAGPGTRIVLYAKQAASGAEMGTIVTSKSTGGNWSTLIVRISGVDPGGTWNESAGTSSAQNTATVPQSPVTSTGPDRLAVQAFTWGNGFNARSVSAQYPNYTTWRQSGLAQFGVGFCTAPMPAAATISGGTATLSGGADVAGSGVALIGAQAAGVSGAPPSGGSLRRRRRRRADLVAGLLERGA